MRQMHAVDLDFSGVRAEYELPDTFPDEVERAAAAATDRFADDRVDALDLPFVTIDPPGALDLDQAVHLARTDAGFRLSYAIADLGAFIVADDPIDVEARRRGQTIYLPDGSVPLHPRVLSEERASLVAGEDRPAVLWEVEADAAGALLRARVRRALVHVTERLDYAGVQSAVDRGEALPEAIALLPEFGALRAAQALERGAIELQLPAQELTATPDGGWQLRLEPRTHADAWNSECSLATGIAAAACMVRGGAGLLRTLPAPDEDALAQFRAAARALGIPVDAAQSPGALLASLPHDDPAAMALHTAATKLLRGSGYLAFDTRLGEPMPTAAQRWHNGVATEYAHVTAPIRRLADRFAAELCLELGGGEWFDVGEANEREARESGIPAPTALTGPNASTDSAAPSGPTQLAAASQSGAASGLAGGSQSAPASGPTSASSSEPVAASDEPQAEPANPLAGIPAIMQRTGQLANAVENACLNLAEATALADSIGDEFTAALLRPGDGRHDAEVFVSTPPVIAQCRGDVPAGAPVTVRLIEADPAKRRVRFAYGDAAETDADGANSDTTESAAHAAPAETI